VKKRTPSPAPSEAWWDIYVEYHDTKGFVYKHHRHIDEGDVPEDEIPDWVADHARAAAAAIGPLRRKVPE
jgi:hypothetical protein